MKRFVHFFRVVFLGTVCLCSANAQRLDVAQLEYDQTNDLSSNGKSGQSFTAGRSAELVGIRLYVQREQFSTTDPAGSDFIISLHPVVVGVVRSTPITTGLWSRDTIPIGQVVAVDVMFDRSYEQTSGEHLAFTIQGTSGGGVNGFNVYGMQTGDPYAEGVQFYYYSEEDPVASNDMDMAFATLVNISNEAPDQPGAFDYLSPGNSADYFQASLPDKLDWTDASNASAYDVYFEMDDTTPDVLIATVLDSEWYLPENLDLGAYSWRVIARNSAGTRETGTWSFNVVEPLPPLPGPFIGYSPGQAQQYILPSKPYELRWYPSSDADHYYVYLEKGDSTPDALVATRSAGYLFYPIAETLDEGTWYWKVVSRNEAGIFESSVRSFIIKPRIPGSFSLLSPSSWASYQLPDLPARFDWSGSAGADSYEIVLRRTLPSEIVITKTVSESEWIVDSALADGTWVWSVTARNVSGERSTTVRHFTIRPANRSPSDLLLTNSTVPENTFFNYRIGGFITSDPDEVDRFNYTFVDGVGSEDNKVFTIVGNSLEVDQPFDYEFRSSYQIRVQTTDSWGESLEKAFTITVLDADEPPFEQVQIAKRTLGRWLITWNTEAGYTYQVYYSDTLNANDWHKLGVSRSPYGETMAIYDTPPDGLEQRFYKIEKIPED